MKKLILLFLFVLPILANAQIDKNTIKTYFETGDNPTQAQFYEFIDFVGQKVDTVAGKGLSTEDFTTAYKTSLDNLASNYAALNHNHDATYAPIAAGLPTGGTSGQVLKKLSGTNYDVAWATDNDSGGGGGGSAGFDNYIYPENSGCVGDGATDDSANFKLAADSARDEGRPLYLSSGKRYYIPTFTGWNSSTTGQSFIMRGPGAIDLGNSTTWFIDVNHANCTVDINGIEYTGGNFVNAGAAGGLVTIDGSITSTTEVKLQNINAHDAVCILWANAGGTANRKIEKLIVHNVQMVNFKWRGIVYTGEQPDRTIINDLYGEHIMNFVLNLGDEDYVNATTNEGVICQITGLHGIDVRDTTGSSQANVLKFQGWRNLILDDAFGAQCNTSTNADAEVFYFKAVNATITNVIAEDGEGEAIFGFKGVSPLNGAGTASAENDKILMQNITARVTPTWHTGREAQEFKGILYKTDNLIADGIFIENVDVGIDFLANNDANYDLNADDGDLIYGDVRITNLHVNNYTTYALEANSTKMKSFRVQGFASNHTGTHDGNDILVAWVRGDMDYVELDFTLSRVATGNMNNNDAYLIEQQSGTNGKWDLIVRGDEVGRVAALDRSTTGIFGRVDIYNHCAVTDDSQLHRSYNGTVGKYKVRYVHVPPNYEFYKPFAAPTSGTSPVSLDIDYDEPWPVYKYNTGSTADIQLAPVNRTEIGQEVAVYINNDQGSSVNAILPTGDKGTGDVTTATVVIPANTRVRLINKVIASDNGTTELEYIWSKEVLTAAF